MNARASNSSPPFATAFTAGLALFLIVSVPRAAAALPPVFRLPQPVVRTLPNGLTVAVFRDARLPLVHVQLTVVAGSAAEGALPAGTAYITSQMIGQSTASRDPEALREDLERAGGQLATRMGRDAASLSGTFLASQLPLALEVVADAGTHALLTDNDFARARRLMRAMASGAAGGTRLPEDRLWAAAFGDAGYGHPPAGTVESFDRMTINDVRHFYSSRWGPSGAVLAIVGDVQPDSVGSLVADAFGAWSARASQPALAAPPLAPARSLSLVHRKDATRCEVWVGVPGPPAGDPDELPIALASQLAVRAAAGLSGVRVGQSALRNGGFLWLSATARLDSAAIVARKLSDAFTSLRGAAPKETELAALKSAVLAGFAMRFETLDGLADQWCSEATLGLGFEVLADFPARIQAVTKSQVAAATKKWFDPSRMSLVAAGPADRLRGPLAAIARIQESEGIDDPVTPAMEKRGRERVAAMVAAHGSLATLKKVRDSVLEAEVTASMGPRDVAASLMQIRKEPGRMVVDSKYQGVGLREVWVGERGWSSSIDTLTTARDADTTTVTRMRNDFREDVIHLLLDAADPRTRVASRGTTLLNGQSLERVEIWTAFGAHRTLFIDTGTHRLSGIELHPSGDRAGTEPIRRWYRDYRAMDGVRLPFDEERWLGERRMMRLKITRYALNPGVADELFVHPEAPLPPFSR